MSLAENPSPIIIKDVTEILDWADEVQHRNVPVEGVIIVKSKLIIGGYEFTNKDTHYRPVKEIGRSHARNLTELLDLVVKSIRDGDLTMIHGHPVVLEIPVDEDEE